MTQRDPTALVQLKVRIRESLRAQLEEAATQKGISLNAEIADRLTRSLDEEHGFGGPELHRIALLMASTFALAGDRHSKHKPASEWLRDEDTYFDAAIAVLAALLQHKPRALSPELQELTKRLRKELHLYDFGTLPAARKRASEFDPS